VIRGEGKSRGLVVCPSKGERRVKTDRGERKSERKVALREGSGNQEMWVREREYGV